MSETLYPWLIKPLLSPAIWGGTELLRTYGKSGDPHTKFGESWECWDANQVMNGALRGSTIAELRKKLTTQFLGDLDASAIFPILTKIITAHDWLSVQVHPNDAYAQLHENQASGKTECWLVIDAEPHAEIILGWVRDTSRAEYEQRINDGTLDELLRRVPVTTGDTVYVPAGLVHAIGPGVTVVETQQASDLTYRMYDWKRVDQTGKPRQLQTEKAADVVDYKFRSLSILEKIDYAADGFSRTALIADPRFSLESVLATPNQTSLATNDHPLIIMSLHDPLEVSCAGITVTLCKFQTVLIPTAAHSVVVCSTENPAPFLCITMPRASDEYAARLLNAGVANSQVTTFINQFTLD